MKNRTAVLLAIAVGGAGLVIGMLFSWSNAQAAADQARAAERAAMAAAASHERVPAQEPPVLERPDSRVPALTESPKAPELPPATPATAPPPSEFAGLLAMPESTKAEKKAKEQAIRAILSERTTPLLLKRFEAGFGEYLYPEQKYSGLPEDEGVIYGVQMPGGGTGTYRTVLPRAEYPELYELHDAADRLAKESLAMGMQEAREGRTQAGQPTPR